MTIFNDDSAWDPLVVDTEVDAILDRYGIRDDRIRQKVIREARIRLSGRATRDVSRLMASRALAAGWRPAAAQTEPWVGEPLPVSATIRERVIRWASLRSDFSARDVQRAFDWFERAIDARTCLNGLVAQGQLEMVAPLRRVKRGRLPSPRYRAVRADRAGALREARSPASPHCADAPDLQTGDQTP